MIKPEQRCSGLFVCRKIYAPYKGAESISPAARILGGEWEHPDEPSGELIQSTDYDGIDIITTNMSLFGATCTLMKENNGDVTERFKKFLLEGTSKDGSLICAKYDYCIIDNPPDIGINVINALAASDEVIVPVKIDEDALEGLDIVAEQIEDAKAINPLLT